MENPFEKLEPRDGYRVVEVSCRPLEISLHVVLYVHGEPGESHEIWSAKKPTLADEGTLSRLRLLAEAMCHYFNAGGTWDELDTVTSASRPNVMSISPPGWYLIDTYFDTDGHITYVWYNRETTKVVRWAHDFIDTQTWHQHLAELRDENDADDEQSSGHPEAAGLPGGEDSEAEEGNVFRDRPAIPGPGTQG